MLKLGSFIYMQMTMVISSPSMEAVLGRFILLMRLI
jgi:hypothetical protein